MATLLELWRESTEGTPWSSLNLERELANVEKLAVRPRIPDDHLIFRIFRAFPDPRRQIKVVLLGQDPYPGIFEDPEQSGTVMTHACGFSFSSPLGPLPKSLQPIFGEILRTYPQPLVKSVGRRAPRPAVSADYKGDLSYLVADGVFLLNTYLTIHFDGTKGEPLSHTSWLAFTTQILNFIRRTCPKAVYLALGKKAADLMKASGVNDAIECDHPANRFGGRNPFKGSDIFLQADALMESRGLRKIDWIPMKTVVDHKYYDKAVSGVPRAADIVEQPIPTRVLPAISGISVDEDDDDVH